MEHYIYYKEPRRGKTIDFIKKENVNKWLAKARTASVIPEMFDLKDFETDLKQHQKSYAQSVYESDDRGKYPVEIDEFDTETAEAERLIIVKNYLMKEQVKEKSRFNFD